MMIVLDFGSAVIRVLASKKTPLSSAVCAVYVGGVCDKRYVWGLRYIDDLVMYRVGATDYYSVADPNWNVIAVTNSTGVVQERYTYSSFGKANFFDASFTSKSASTVANTRLFTGQVFDAESGLMLYRNRYYHTILGRFVSRDPIGYEAGDKNLTRYVKNKVIMFFDPTGLKSTTRRLPPEECYPCNCNCPTCRGCPDFGPEPPEPDPEPLEPNPEPIKPPCNEKGCSGACIRIIKPLSIGKINLVISGFSLSCQAAKRTDLESIVPKLDLSTPRNESACSGDCSCDWDNATRHVERNIVQVDDDFSYKVPVWGTVKCHAKGSIEITGEFMLSGCKKN